MAAGRPGDRLPSVRELMRRHGAGPVTVQRAVHLLAGARAGRGAPRPRHVRRRARRRAARGRRPTTRWQTLALGPRRLDTLDLEHLLRPPPPGVLVLSTGYLPDDLQPHGALGQALARAARRPGAWGPVPPEGLAPLRAQQAAWLGGGHTADDVLVTAGGQAALTACLRGLAAPGGAARRRVADLPRRARRGPRGRPRRVVPVPSDERRPAARPARRRARRLRRPARLPAAELREPARGHARPRAARRRARGRRAPRARS